MKGAKRWWTRASGPGCVQCGLGGVSALHRCVTSSPELLTHLLWSRFRGQELEHGPAGSSALESLAGWDLDVSRGWGLSRRPDRGRVRLPAHSVTDGSIQLLDLLTGGPSSSLAPRVLATGPPCGPQHSRSLHESKSSAKVRDRGPVGGGWVGSQSQK